MEVAHSDPEWATGFEDECWWSRVALPALSSFSEEGEPKRLLQHSVAKDDPDYEGHLLLRTLPARTRGHLAEIRGREAGKFDNDAVPFVELREARSRWQEGSASHLGQRQLACLQRGEALARQAQPRGQNERRGGEDRELLAAQAEPVAERHRTQMGTRQAQGGGVRRSARCLRTRRQGLRGIR